MSAKKVKIGSVSYLNAKPLIYGFETGLMKEEIELLTGNPADIAGRLISNTIDIGLVPVAIIPQLTEHHIIGTHCIGAVGEVASVCLFSDVPLEQIKTVLLDYQSRTSVALLQILMKKHWKIEPLVIRGEAGYEHQIQGTTAGLVIGDRAFVQKGRSAFAFDLSAAWMEMTGLPFVFAAWISNKSIDQSFITAFDNANALGFEHLDAIVAAHPGVNINLMDYYRCNISYRLDEPKMAGLKLFLSMLS